MSAITPLQTVTVTKGFSPQGGGGQQNQGGPLSSSFNLLGISTPNYDALLTQAGGPYTITEVCLIPTLANLAGLYLQSDNLDCTVVFKNSSTTEATVNLVAGQAQDWYSNFTSNVAAQFPAWTLAITSIVVTPLATVNNVASAIAATNFHIRLLLSA